MAIDSFRDEGTEDIAAERITKASRRKLPIILHAAAYRKLVFLDNAYSLADLSTWKSLRLEKLKGDRTGEYSIRINNQYRVCFSWTGTDAVNVEIVDYH